MRLSLIHISKLLLRLQLGEFLLGICPDGEYGVPNIEQGELCHAERFGCADVHAAFYLSYFVGNG